MTEAVAPPDALRRRSLRLGRDRSGAHPDRPCPTCFTSPRAFPHAHLAAGGPTRRRDGRICAGWSTSRRRSTRCTGSRPDVGRNRSARRCCATRSSTRSTTGSRFCWRQMDAPAHARAATCSATSSASSDLYVAVVSRLSVRGDGASPRRRRRWRRSCARGRRPSRASSSCGGRDAFPQRRRSGVRAGVPTETRRAGGRTRGAE